MTKVRVLVVVAVFLMTMLNTAQVGAHTSSYFGHGTYISGVWKTIYGGDVSSGCSHRHFYWHYEWLPIYSEWVYRHDSIYTFVCTA